MWVAFWAAAIGAHAAFIGILIALHHAPLPRLYVEFVGEGKGTLISEDGIHCVSGDGPAKDRCRARIERGRVVQLRVLLEEGSVLASWQGCTPDPAFPEQCWLTLDRTSSVAVFVDKKPDEKKQKEEELRAQAENPDVQISLLDPSVDVPRLEVPLPPPPADEEEKKKPKLPELAMVEPPPVQIIPPPPAPEPPPPPPPNKQPVKAPPEMKSVEVPDENKVERAPDDATFLSDENRDVAVETRATDTNLEQEKKGKVAASEESARKDAEVGGKEEEIAQLDDVDPTSLEAERVRETETRGSSKQGEVPRGQAGDDGQGGQRGDDSSADKPGALAMRGIQGRGVPGGPMVNQERRDEMPGRRGDPGRIGRRGIKTEIDFEDYERIVGTDVAKREVEMGRKRQSKRLGRFEQKQAAVKAALENFVPEVRPGNQTALKTRKAPFALYIARMHRRIHELWGFGFLEELEGRSSSDPMNNPKLESIIEVAVNPDGTIHKTTIVQPSGVLQYDVAAIDTLYTGGPYDETPPEIRSVDGRVYLHWVFRRDWEQCGTFNVRMYILDKVNEGKHDDGELIRNMRKQIGKPPAPGDAAGGATGGGGAAGDAGATGTGTGDPGASARAHANLPAPEDPAAQHAANLWVTGFVHGDVAKMIKVSGVPFSSGEQVVANAPGELTPVYRNIRSESPGSIREWKLLTAAGYRKRFGALPPGAVSGTDALFMVVRAGGDRFTVVMTRQPNGDYRATGFHR